MPAESRRRHGGLKKERVRPKSKRKKEEDEKRAPEIEEMDQRGEGENSSRARREANS